MKRSILLVLAILGLLLAGCSDDDSVVTPSVDTAPPAIPTGFVCCAQSSAAKLSWEPNTTDEDLAGYVVYRTACCQTWRLTEEPIIATRFVDPVPYQGPTMYEVSAVDLSGNESARVAFRINCQRAEQILNEE